MKKIQLLIAAGLTLASALRAEIMLPAIFSDHMVLQQKQADPIWGWDTPGTKITVTFAGQTYSTTAGTDGKWTVNLKPLPANAMPQTLTVSGSNQREIHDVLVGEVWICSGQSNMGFKLVNVSSGDLEIQTAHNNLLRLLVVPNVGTQVLQTNFTGEWQSATPQSTPLFSAIGYMFGRYLQQTLQVPVGMVENAWGGSTVDAWIQRSVLNDDPRFKARMAESAVKEATLLPDNGDSECARIDANWKADCEKAKSEGKPLPWKPIDRWLESAKRPGNIYAGVLYPTIGYGIKGVIWYQGESDYGRPGEYTDLFSLMIEEWRKDWNEGDFPFYWVQLPKYRTTQPDGEKSGWVQIREAQTRTLSQPNTAEVVTIDLGEANNIHPRSKQEVAARLARVALARDYGIPVKYRSAIFKALIGKGNKADIVFDCFNSKLMTLNRDEVDGFTICGPDKKWWAAQGRLVDDHTVEVWSDHVQVPLAVRYDWSEIPEGNLYTDDARLPVTPFTTEANR